MRGLIYAAQGSSALERCIGRGLVKDRPTLKTLYDWKSHL